MATTWDVEVVRNDLRQARIVDGAPIPADPADGTAVVRIEAFALTANNVTYGAVGDLVGNSRSFPASEDGWGRIPVWGHGAVVASAVDGGETGTRYFGFWPMSTHTVVQPGSIGPTGSPIAPRTGSSSQRSTTATSGPRTAGRPTHTSRSSRRSWGRYSPRRLIDAWPMNSIV